jgi:hypothetical protein
VVIEHEIVLRLLFMMLFMPPVVSLVLLELDPVLDLLLDLVLGVLPLVVLDLGVDPVDEANDRLELMLDLLLLD